MTVNSPTAQHIVQQLREAGALTADTARPFHAQSRVEELEFRRLLRVGVIREPLPGRYCLDSRGIQPTTLALEITSTGSAWTERDHNSEDNKSSTPV